MSETQPPQRMDRFIVRCDECDEVVEFDILEFSWFGNKHAALWYAGFHAGTEHADVDYQCAMPFPATAANTEHLEEVQTDE